MATLTTRTTTSRPWARIGQRIAARRARRLAIQRLAALQPSWYALRFDDTFAQRLPPDVVAAGDAEGIARDWTMQFIYHDERQRERDVRQLVPVVDAYLTLLAHAERELGLSGAA